MSGGSGLQVSRTSSTNLQLLEPVVLNLNFRVLLGDSEFAWLACSYLVLVYICFCHSNVARTVFRDGLLSAYTVLQACASISLHGWGDMHTVANQPPHYCPLIYLHSPGTV